MYGSCGRRRHRRKFRGDCRPWTRRRRRCRYSTIRYCPWYRRSGFRWRCRRRWYWVAMDDREPSLDGVSRTARNPHGAVDILWPIQPFLDFCNKEQSGRNQIVEKHDRNTLVVFLIPRLVRFQTIVKHAQSRRCVQHCGIKDGERTICTCCRALSEQLRI